MAEWPAHGSDWSLSDEERAESLARSAGRDIPMAISDPSERAALEARSAKLTSLIETLDAHLEALSDLYFQAALHGEEGDERLSVAPLKRELRDWLDLEHERVGLALHAKEGETRTETAYRLAFPAMHEDGADASSARVW